LSTAATRSNLRRSLFFVPGSEPRKLEKARTAGADTLLLDLEDSVAIPDKERARELVAALLREGGFGAAETAVRVNPPGTPWFEDDLRAAVEAGAQAILVPKAEDAAQLSDVARRLDTAEAKLGRTTASPARLLALVETAAGIARATQLGAASPRIDALCFGHADFSRDMGLSTADAATGVLLHARTTLSIAAHASGLAAIDTVYLDVRDEAGFRRDAELGLGLGFEGKLCIHPTQVTIANDVHTPGKDAIAYARRVLEALHEADREGRGVFTVDGKMVDAPIVEAQRRVLERARRAGLVPSEKENDDG
jgi:citrate lyase subunit beta/citryl-CoA lyase